MIVKIPHISLLFIFTRLGSSVFSGFRQFTNSKGDTMMAQIHFKNITTVTFKLKSNNKPSPTPPTALAAARKSGPC